MKATVSTMLSQARKVVEKYYSSLGHTGDVRPYSSKMLARKKLPIDLCRFVGWVVKSHHYVSKGDNLTMSVQEVLSDDDAPESVEQEERFQVRF